MLRFSDNRNQAINKRIADITLEQYNKGLAEKSSEEPIDAVDSNTIETITTKDGKTGYSTKKRVLNSKVSLNKSKDILKDFMTQSQILDNELNQMVSQFKLNNKQQFFGGALDTDGNENHYNDYEHSYEHTIAAFEEILKEDHIDNISAIMGQTVTKPGFRKIINAEFPL